MTFQFNLRNTVDPVNKPPHYADGRAFEVIDVIEDSVQFAPDPVLGGLQWQVLKYVHRCWNKENSKQDLMKAQWYLTRLIESLEE
jgi:hypothetical protein